MATYKHIRSNVDSKRPTTSLADGQIAINTNVASPGVFFKDSAGTGIVKVGPVHVGTSAPNSTPGAGGSTGNSKGEQWLDTSLTPAQLKVWNGSAWVGVVADELPVSKLQNGSAYQLLQTDAAGTGVEWASDIDVPGSLNVTSTAVFDSTVSHPLGSAAAPTITFTGDANTGIYSPGIDQVAITTGGTGRLYVAADGKVGIGTSSPSGKLEVDGRIRVLDNNDAAPTAGKGLEISYFNTADYADILSYDRSSDAYKNLYLRGNNLVLKTGTTEAMRIDSSGRLLVGTSSTPVSSTAVLQGRSGATTTEAILRLCRGQDTPADGALLGDLSFGDSNNGDAARIFAQRDGGTWTSASSRPTRLVFSTTADGTSSPTERLRIDSSGNIGIGTSSPDTKLTVGGNNAAIRIQPSNVANASIFLRHGSVASNSGLVADANSALALYANGSERARIDSSGRLLVGTSTSIPESGHQTFEMASSQGGHISLARDDGSVTANDILARIRAYGNDGGSYQECGRIEFAADGTHAADDKPTRLVFSTTADGASSPTERMRIASSGNILFNFDGSSATGVARFADGTESAPGISFWADGSADTGIFRPGANIIGFTTGGTERLRIDSSGRVGIGTTSPDSRFHVVGSTGDSVPARISNNATLCTIGFETSTAANSYSVRCGGSGANDFVIYTDNAEKLRIDSSGRLLSGLTSAPGTVGGFSHVNIGGTSINANGAIGLYRNTASPSSGQGIGAISFANSEGNRGALIQALSGGTWGTNDYPGVLAFSTTADGASTTTERMRIDSSGNVGIGTLSPEYLFDARGSINISGSIFRRGADNANFSLTNRAAQALTFGTNDTERMRIDSSGNVGIGTTSTGEKLNINGKIKLQFGSAPLVTLANAGDGTNAFDLDTTTTVGNGSGLARFYNNGVQKCRIEGDGSLQNATNSYGALSDLKLKENVVDANSQWDDLKALQVRNYNLKAETQHQTHPQIGLIAQEVELVSPGLVRESPDRDEDGNDLGTVTKSVNYSVLYMKAVKALQEAMERIETLEQRLSDAGIA